MSIRFVQRCRVIDVSPVLVYVCLLQYASVGTNIDSSLADTRVTGRKPQRTEPKLEIAAAKRRGGGV